MLLFACTAIAALEYATVQMVADGSFAKEKEVAAFEALKTWHAGDGYDVPTSQMQLTIDKDTFIIDVQIPSKAYYTATDLDKEWCSSDFAARKEAFKELMTTALGLKDVLSVTNCVSDDYGMGCSTTTHCDMHRQLAEDTDGEYNGGLEPLSIAALALVLVGLIIVFGACFWCRCCEESIRPIDEDPTRRKYFAANEADETGGP